MDNLYKLSVLVPGIRPNNWLKLYDSLCNAYSGTWEIIFISPYDLPKVLTETRKKNVRLIQDWGTPMRCQQRGLIEAQGDYIVWAADDGVFISDSLNIAFSKVKDKDYKTVVTGKYLEGTPSPTGITPMLQDDYYYLNNHGASNFPFLPEKTLMLNVGIVSRKLLLEIGGWDCQFEVCPMAFNDLAIRLRRYGCEFILQEEMMFKCAHTPGHEGDHGPIHDAQIFHDQPLFTLIYCDKDKSQRTIIDIDNWKNVPTGWERRFGANPSSS